MTPTIKLYTAAFTDNCTLTLKTLYFFLCSWCHTKRRIGETPTRQSFFWYDNDKNLKGRFPVTRMADLSNIHDNKWNYLILGRALDGQGKINQLAQMNVFIARRSALYWTPSHIIPFNTPSLSRIQWALLKYPAA